MIRTFALFALLGTFAAGCDTDCADAARANGVYAVWHTVLDAGTDGAATVSADYPTYQVFMNGWSKWNMTASSSGTLNVDITDVAERQGDFNATTPTTQGFEGTFEATDDNCNVFNLHLEGDFVTTVNTTHTFVYDSKVVYMGDHLSGSFSYDDTYTGTADDGTAISGSAAGVTGDVYGTLQSDGFDTGF